MRYGYVIPNGDLATIIELAVEVEAAGWDGAFYWDGIYSGPDTLVYDPWVTMAAMALRTSTVRIGAMLTPPTRRRPWKLARETVTLDHLSQGRLVLPMGLGAVTAFGAVGEEEDRKVRAERLDESLDILTGLWTAKPFSYQGKHFQLGEMTFVPPPLQQPRIPLWVVAAWPSERSMARALRYDGVLPTPLGAGPADHLTPEMVQAIRAYMTAQGTSEDFDLIVEGVTPTGDAAGAAAQVRPFADAGATWWIESPWTVPNAPDDLRRRIRQGPPVSPN